MDFHQKTYNLNTANTEDTDEVEDENASFSKQMIITKFFNILKFYISQKIKPESLCKFLLFLSVLAYVVFLSYVFKLNNPFKFFTSAALNSTSNIYEDFVFKNNKSLAILLLSALLTLSIVWEKLLPYFMSIYQISRFNSDLELRGKLDNLFYAVLCICIIWLLALEFNHQNMSSMISMFGLFSFIAFCFVLSENPSRVKVKTVVGGLFLQLALGLFVMRANLGYFLFKFIVEQIQVFLSFTDAGTRLVFGNIEDHYIAFKAIPVLIFFSSCINLLYFVGLLQYIVLKCSWLINKFMKTSPSESVTIVMNVFVGMAEAPLIIKPFFSFLTDSEYFSIMTGGYATIAGYSLAGNLGSGYLNWKIF